jgi:peptide deformylase
MSEELQVYSCLAPVLREKALPIEGGVTDEIRDQMDAMLRTMYEDRGIGLAANQVGLTNRVIVMDLAGATWHLEDEDEDEGDAKRVVVDYGDEESEPKSEPLYMANPEITWKSDERSVYQEGCLSVPGQYADVERPARVKVKFLDYDGKEQEIEADGLFSHCVQHEIDHLDGVLFIDYLSKLKRDMVIKKIKKLTKGQQVL